MSTTVTISAASTFNGDGASGTYTPPQSPMTNVNAPDSGPVTYPLPASLQTTIPVPSGSLRAMLTPPSTSGVIKLLKTISGDTGVAFTNDFQIITVNGLANIYINVAGAVADSVKIVWG